MNIGERVVVVSLYDTRAAHGLSSKMEEYLHNKTVLKVIGITRDSNSIYARSFNDEATYTYIRSDLKSLEKDMKEKPEHIFHYEPSMLMV